MNAAKPTPAERAAAKRVRIRKHGGDDRYSWAMFVDGRITYAGSDQYQAQADRRRAIRNIAAGRHWNDDGPRH